MATQKSAALSATQHALQPGGHAMFAGGSSSLSGLTGSVTKQTGLPAGESLEEIKWAVASWGKQDAAQA
jgi:hypothetical protein